MKSKIGIIGFGNMGSSIAERLSSDFSVTVFDKDKEKTKNLSIIEVVNDIGGLVKKADTVILAVKPQDFQALLDEIKSRVKEKLIVSIAAGISTGYIEKILGQVKVIRVMPNIGAKIGKAESFLCKGRYSLQQDLEFARDLFNHIGKTWVIKEEMMDAATAISGSGLAYIYYDMEINGIKPSDITEEIKQEYIDKLTKAAEDVGFDKDIALEMAVSTTGTSADLVLQPGMSATILRNMVTSKGGTTEAALKVLSEKKGSWSGAALAAKKRAGELSKE